MTTDTNSEDLHKDEIDLVEFLSVWWSGKWFILATGLVALLGSAFITMNMDNVYRAESLLALNAKGGGAGALAGITGGYGGVASLAGFGFGGLTEGTNQKNLAIKTLKSRKFFGDYLYEETLVELMASKSWDIESSQLEIDAAVYDVKERKWINTVNASSSKPSVQKAYNQFLSHLRVTEDAQDGHIVISVEHLSPYVASRWVQQLVSKINEAFKERDIQEARRAIDYLLEQQKKTSVVSLIEVFSDLIEEQTKTMMLASVSDEYVFRVIDPAVAPEMKIKPNRTFICLISTIITGLISLVVVTGNYFIRRQIGTWRNSLVRNLQ